MHIKGKRVSRSLPCKDTCQSTDEPDVVKHGKKHRPMTHSQVGLSNPQGLLSWFKTVQQRNPVGGCPYAPQASIISSPTHFTSLSPL